MSLSSFLDIRTEKKSLVYSIYYLYLCSGLASNLLGAILPAMQVEYGMSYALRGYVLSAHQIGNFLAVLLAGFVPYAIGRKNSTIMMGSLTVFGLMIMTLTGNPFLLILAFAFTGMGRGTITNITNVVVNENTGNKSAGLNILHASYAIGAFISPFAAVVATKYEWRYAAWLFAAFMISAFIFTGRSNMSSKPMKKEKGGADFFFCHIFQRYGAYEHIPLPEHAVASMDHDSPRQALLCGPFFKIQQDHHAHSHGCHDDGKLHSHDVVFFDNTDCRRAFRPWFLHEWCVSDNPFHNGFPI